LSDWEERGNDAQRNSGFNGLAPYGPFGSSSWVAAGETVKPTSLIFVLPALASKDSKADRTLLFLPMILQTSVLEIEEFEAVRSILGQRSLLNNNPIGGGC